MRSATSSASSTLVAVPFGGCASPSSRAILSKRRRSSAMSIASGDVPRIFTPAASSGRVSLSGVWPPSCTITPSGCSRCTISSTSSNVSGSKYSLSDVSKSVETVSGFELIMIVSYPCSRSAMHRAHAAVVELDALPDAIRPAAEDDDRASARCAAPRSPRRSCRRDTASPTETRRRRCRPSCTTGARPAPSAARARPPPSRRAARRAARSEKPMRFMRRSSSRRRPRRARRSRAPPRAARASGSRNHGSIAGELVDLGHACSPRSSARFTWKIRSGVGWRSAPRSASSVSSGRRSSMQRARRSSSRGVRSRARAAPSGTLP